MVRPGTKCGAGWPASRWQLARLKASGAASAARGHLSARATSRESRHGTQPLIPRPFVTWRPAAFHFTPLVATGLVLCAVDLMTALLAMRLFDRLRVAAPDPWALSDYRPQMLLLVLAVILALLPLLHLASKVFAHAARRSSRRHACLRAARMALCVPASLCPVTVITLLLTTGH